MLRARVHSLAIYIPEVWKFQPYALPCPWPPKPTFHYYSELENFTPSSSKRARHTHIPRNQESGIRNHPFPWRKVQCLISGRIVGRPVVPASFWLHHRKPRVFLVLILRYASTSCREVSRGPLTVLLICFHSNAPNGKQQGLLFFRRWNSARAFLLLKNDSRRPAEEFHEAASRIVQSSNSQNHFF